MTRILPPTRGTAGHGHQTAEAPGAGPRRGVAVPGYLRPLLGLATIVTIVGIVGVAIALFQGGFAPSVRVTVLSPRAGLVMNPDAKVKMRGVQVGRVESIEARPDGQAALHLAMDPSQLHLIPANVLVDIASSTVFGAKFVQLVAPAAPSPQSLRPGQVLAGQRVTVEPNTVFQQLTSLLSKIDPVKLNETLGAMSAGLNGRGDQLGQMLRDFDALLTELDPSRPALNHDLSVSAVVMDAYGDAAPHLAKTMGDSVPISRSIVDERKNLDEMLLSTIGLADTGSEVLGTSRQPLTDSLHRMVPTTDLFNDYHEAITCGIGGAIEMAKEPPAQRPGINLLIGLDLGVDRYRYPQDLPRVAATGGPQCTDLPVAPFGGHPPFVVADTGANPFKYENLRMIFDSDLIKQWLFGPIDGPPRNSAQVGNPG